MNSYVATMGFALEGLVDVPRFDAIDIFQRQGVGGFLLNLISLSMSWSIIMVIVSVWKGI